jgi:tRNA-binding protein
MQPELPAVAPSTFFAVDLRVGRVVAAEPFLRARKPAHLLTVDFGPLGLRRTSAQVTNYRPEDLVGRLVVGALNLGSRRIAGVNSEFLVLGAVAGDGTVRLLSPDPGALAGERIA